MILSSLITISDWLPLAKQKSTYNFELEMLVNILITIKVWEFNYDRWKTKKTFNRVQVQKLLWSRLFSQHLSYLPWWRILITKTAIATNLRQRFVLPQIILFQKTSENVFQWLFLWNFGVFWQYLGEQASDRQLPVSRICKQRQNYESVEKIVRF